MSDRPSFIDKTTIDRPVVDLHRGQYGRVTADAAAILEHLVHPAVATNPAHAMWMRFLDSPWKRVFENLAQCVDTTTDQLDQTLATDGDALTDDAARFAELEHVVALSMKHAEQINENFIGPEHLIVGLIRSLQTNHPGEPHNKLAERAPDMVMRFLGKANA